MNIWPRRLGLKKETKAGSNQPPARDPVQFKLELMPNYLISYLENTGSRCTRYISMSLPNESSILPKFLEKSDPEVARPAFSTWPVQKSQPKAFEVCASIQIHAPISVSRPNKHPCPGQGCGFELPTVAICWLVDLNRRASQRARSREVTRAVFYPLIWLANIKTKGFTSRKIVLLLGFADIIFRWERSDD